MTSWMRALAAPSASVVDRLIPRVQTEIERAPVHGEQRAAAEHAMRDERVVGAEMDLAPRRVVRADLEHHEIERAAALADGLELGREAGVAAEEHAMARRRA